MDESIMNQSTNSGNIVSDKQKLQHLINNGKLINKLMPEVSLELDKNGKLVQSENWNYSYDNWEIYEEWFNNIPKQGRLCRVWDQDGDTFQFETIIQYDPTRQFPFLFKDDADGNLIGYKFAEPLSPKEIEAYKLLNKL
jgi:hypothetical protein